MNYLQRDMRPNPPNKPTDLMKDVVTTKTTNSSNDSNVTYKREAFGGLADNSPNIQDSPKLTRSNLESMNQLSQNNAELSKRDLRSVRSEIKSLKRMKAELSGEVNEHSLPQIIQEWLEKINKLFTQMQKTDEYTEQEIKKMSSEWTSASIQLQKYRILSKDLLAINKNIEYSYTTLHLQVIGEGEETPRMW